MPVNVTSITVRNERKLATENERRKGLIIRNGEATQTDLLLSWGGIEATPQQHSVRLKAGERLELLGDGIVPVQSIRAAPQGGSDTTAHLTEWT